MNSKETITQKLSAFVCGYEIDWRVGRGLLPEMCAAATTRREWSVPFVGTVGPEPKDITGAQFSSHFSLGLTMVKGSNDFRSYFEAMNNGFSDREVIEVAKKVNVVHDEESEAIYPTTRLGKVSLETKHGTKHSAKVFHPRGSPENPLTRHELEDKFLGLASMVVSWDRAKELLHAVQNLEQMKDVSDLAGLTVSG